MGLERKRRSKQFLNKIPNARDLGREEGAELFGIRNFPEYFGEGKNSFRIKPEQGFIIPNSPIRIEILDSNDRPIYWESPHYKDSDKSQVISVWAYSDRNSYHTADGPCELTIVASGVDGPIRYQRKINVVKNRKSVSDIIFTQEPKGNVSASVESFNELSQTNGKLTQTVASGEFTYTKSIYGDDVSLEVGLTEVVTNTTVSASLTSNTLTGGSNTIPFATSNLDDNSSPWPNFYENADGSVHIYSLTQTFSYLGSKLRTAPVDTFDTNLITLGSGYTIHADVNGTTADYQLVSVLSPQSFEFTSGSSALIPSTVINGEMISGSLELDLSTTTLFPRLGGGQPQPTNVTASITEIVSNNTFRVSLPITASDERSNGSIHTYEYSDDTITGTIKYLSTGSNAGTQNQVAIANVTLNGVNPIIGRISSVNTLIKSQGLPNSDFELIANTNVLNEDTISYKVAIPTEQLNDPKTIKIQFLNNNGNVSSTEVIVRDVIFKGGNVYVGGGQSLVTGSLFIANAIGSGLEMGGHSSGFLKSVGYDGQISASEGKGPGGFIIYSGSNALQMGADVLTGVGMQFVGDNDDRHLIFSTANGGILDVKTDKFFIGTNNTQFISGSDSNIEISSSLFHLDPKNDRLVIGANAIIEADLSANNIRTPATIGGVQSTDLNASSSITQDGFARFVSASIGGWDITTGSIEGSNLIMKPEGILQTRNFASGVKGWKISSELNGYAEFENVKIRGTLATTTFEKESVNAVGGQLYVANSTTLSGSYSSSVDPVPSAGITSSTTLPSEFGDNSTDKIQVGSDVYQLVSVEDTTKFTIDTPIFADDGSAFLYYSSSNSFSSQVSASVQVNISSNTPYSASLRNRSAISTGDTSFDINNYAPGLNSPSFGDFYDALTPIDLVISETNNTSVFLVGGVLQSTAQCTVTQVGPPDTLELSNGTFNTGYSSETLEFYISYASVVSSTEHQATQILHKKAGTWPATIDNDGEITFDDGGGSHTFDILERISNTQLRIDTSSHKPNTSGSNVVASGFYSSSLQAQRDFDAGTSTTTEFIYTDISPTASVLIADNVTGFANGEILTLKKATNTGFSTEYVKVDSAQRRVGGDASDLSGYLTVTRSYGSGTTGDTASLGDIASVGQSYEEGQVIVSTGKIGSGFIRLNANPNDPSTPYMDIVERTGSGLYDIELKARLGDLSGLANSDLVHGRSTPGFGLATDNVYLQGGIIATFGEIGGFGINATTISSSNNNLILRSNGQITGSAALLSGSDVVIDVEDFTLNSTNFKVNSAGDITGSNVLFNGGTIGGFELGSNIISSSNGDLILKSNGEITASAVKLEGDITANTGRFDDVTVAGIIAQDDSADYILESWITSSAFISSSYNYGGSLVNAGILGETFKHGVLTWTLDSGSDVTYDTFIGQTVSASKYEKATPQDTQATSPPTFKRWVDIKGFGGVHGTGVPYGYPDEYVTPSTVENIIFPFPNYNASAAGDTHNFSITSNTISLPSTLISGNVLNGLVLQTAVRFGPSFGGFSPTFRVEILKPDNTVVKQFDIASRNAGEWLPISLPLTDALINVGSQAVTIQDELKIKLSWFKQSPTAGGGFLNEIRIGELRIVKAAASEGLFVKGLQFEQSSFLPTKYGTAHHGNFVPGTDNTYDLGQISNVSTGTPNQRWDDIYATNGTIQTSDETQKTNITSSDLGLSFVNELRPVSYNWINKTRTHYGLIAQEVSSSLNVFSKTTSDFAGITTGSLMGLRYNELISPMIKAIQELSDEVNQLKIELSQSRG